MSDNFHQLLVVQRNMLFEVTIKQARYSRHHSLRDCRGFWLLTVPKGVINDDYENVPCYGE